MAAFQERRVSSKNSPFKQQSTTPSRSNAISPQQEPIEPSGHKPYRRGVKSSLRQVPDVPGNLLRALFGSVTMSFGAITINPLFLSSFVRMTVSSRGMFVGKLAMVESRGCMLLRLVVLAAFVVMGRLMVMMRGGVMVSGGVVVMLIRRMLR
jgi:hypothetical protein